jgi:gamma-glutamyltranspeptidase/glutathione hydrolase
VTAFDRLKENIVVTGPRVVSAGHAAAASAGAAAYAWGGNAFDAALAACFMEHVVLPMKCGMASDLVALFRRAGGPFQSLVGIGAGVRALAGGTVMERTGPTSVGVPGAPHGYATLHGFARLDLGDLVSAAVRAASDGVPWTRVARSYVVESQKLLAQYSPNNPYSPGGRIPEVGEIRRLPGLGALLQAFAAKREAIFEGEIGNRIVAELQKRGGLLSREDFGQRPGRILDPAQGEIGAGRSPSPLRPPTAPN